MKKIFERIRTGFTCLTGHPTVAMYGITLGVTLAVGLVLSYVMAPHDALAFGRGFLKFRVLPVRMDI